MPSTRAVLHVLTGLIPTILFVTGCAPREPAPRTFELSGQILAIRASNEVLVKHGDIKGFMPAMTMPYRVKDVALLDGKAAGDLVNATLAVSDRDAWLTRIEKTGTAPITDPVPDAAPAARTALLKPGDAVPDTSLTDHEGKPLSLTAWRGSAVAVTFIYTRCPLPEFCPLMDRRFADVQRIAESDSVLAGKVHLLSVSFDPDHDTPAVLRAHADKIGADASVWRFATAPPATVDTFAAAFGVNVIREKDTTITHNLRTAVVAPDGRVVAIYDGNGWTSDQLIADLRQALAPR